MAPEKTIWTISGILTVVWFVGFLANLGDWVHALLIAALLLLVFEMVHARQEERGKR